MVYKSEALIIEQNEIARDVFQLRIEAADLASNGKPGQFVMLAVGGGDTFLRRPFALSSINAESNQVVLVYSKAGIGTGELSKLGSGAYLDVLGPLGSAIEIPESAQSVVLVAGGIGIASLTALAEEAVRLGREVTLLYGAQSNYVMYPGSLLPNGVRELTATEDGSAGHRGFVTHLLLHEEETADWIVACGPTPMLESLARMQKDGSLRKPITALMELRMGCGFGFCYGCTVMTDDGPKLVCKDGPAMQLETIDWAEESAPRVHL